MLPSYPKSTFFYSRRAVARFGLKKEGGDADTRFPSPRLYCLIFYYTQNFKVIQGLSLRSE